MNRHLRIGACWMLALDWLLNDCFCLKAQRILRRASGASITKID